MDDLDDDSCSEKELQEAIAWAGTEPGIRDRLGLRQAQLARLAALNAPAIILANQVRMIAETEAALRGIPPEDAIREVITAIRDRGREPRTSPLHLLGRAVRSWVWRLRGQGRRAVPGLPGYPARPAPRHVRPRGARRPVAGLADLAV